MKKKMGLRPLEERIRMLAGLQEGWLDGEGRAISDTALEIAKSTLSVVGIEHLVGIFPTIEGGVSVESKGYPFFEIEIGPDGSCELTDMTESESDPVVTQFPRPGSGSHILGNLNRALFGIAQRHELHRKALDEGFRGPQGREQRLESLLRRLLPYTNAHAINLGLHRDVLREFVEMRAAHVTFDPVIEFSDVEEILYHDEPVLVEIASTAGPGYAMRVPEDEAGFNYIVAIPGQKMISDIRAGKICLRTAMLDPGCRIYFCDELGENAKAKALAGHLRECCLPDEGLMLKESEPEDVSP